MAQSHMAHMLVSDQTSLLSCWNCTMELYEGPTPNTVYAWQWNVYLEELIHGVGWPAVARVRHRSQIPVS